VTSHRPAPTGSSRIGTTGASRGAGLRRTPRLELRHMANPRELARMRALIEGWAGEVGLTADELVDLQLAVGEAAANGVEHAYRGRPPGPVEIDLELRDRGSSGGAVVVRVLDHGFWRPAPVEAGPRGRGLSLIRTLSAGLDVSPTGGGTEVSFEIPVDRAA
jgi:serine/threonine-protein kinase RsbW